MTTTKIRYRHNRVSRFFRYLLSRWPVADLLGLSIHTCWASLATWAAYGGKGEGIDGVRDRMSGGTTCRVESAIEGHCYCGKFAGGRLTKITEG